MVLAPGRPLPWPQPDGPEGTRTVSLEAGLNFLTWTGDSIEVAEAIVAIGGAGTVETLFRWDPEADQFAVVFPALPGAALGALASGDVLWLRARAAGDWAQFAAAADAEGLPTEAPGSEDAAR